MPTPSRTTRIGRLIDISQDASPVQKLRALEEEAETLALLLDMSALFSSVKELEALMALVVEHTTRIMNCERSSVFLLDREKAELFSLVAQGLDVSELRFDMRQGLAGFSASEGVTLNVPDAYADSRFNPGFDRATGFRTKSVLCAPLRDQSGAVLGVLQCLNKKSAAAGAADFTPRDERLLQAISSQAAAHLENISLHHRMDKLFEAFVEATSRSIDDRDLCTSGHSRRVMQYALNLARAVHKSAQPPFDKVTYTRARLRQLRYAALLHDVGKIGVRENVLSKAQKLPPLNIEVIRLRLAAQQARLRAECAEDAAAGKLPLESLLAEKLHPFRANCAAALQLIEKANIAGFLDEGLCAELERLKDQGLLTEFEFKNLSVRRGNLTEEEWVDMRSHVSRSHRLLMQIPWPLELKDLPEIAFTHHEKRDGSGYPRRLHDDQIHFDGQILCVADIYDALTASDRPYKKAIPPDRAKAILLNEEAAKGKILRELVDLFFNAGCNEIGKVHAADGSPSQDTSGQDARGTV